MIQDEAYKQMYECNINKQINDANEDERMRWIVNRINQYDESSSILEVGSNNGYLAYLLRAHIKINNIIINHKGYHNYTGIDIVQKAVDDCKELIREYNFLKEDIQVFNKNHVGKYDVLVASQVLEHLGNYKQAFKNTWQYLKEDGMMLITVPRENKIYSPDHIVTFDFYTLAELMEENNIDNYKIVFLKKFITDRELNVLGLIAYKGEKDGEGRTFDRGTRH